MMTSNDDKQKIEKKIGEAIGLEMAAQKAVEELSSKGLLDKGGMKDRLEKMRKQANNHQTDLEELILSPSLGLDSSNIQEVANETAQKASEMMKTYLGENPDSSEAIEFLCLAEGGEVTHYEVECYGRKANQRQKILSQSKSNFRGRKEASSTLY
jgi:hypothetical protein